MRRLTFIFMICSLLVAATQKSWADDENILREGKYTGEWIEGVVTVAPYSADHQRMQVDRVNYIIMKDCRVEQLVRKPNDSFEQQPVQLSAIRNGSKVVVKAHGNRISEILLTD